MVFSYMKYTSVDNVEVSIFETDNDGNWRIRQMDMDSGKVIGITFYPTQELALLAFDKLVGYLRKTV